MTDRVPLYPGRVRLTPVSGQTDVYDMTLEDGATVTGTPLNKATLLTDATAELLELESEDPTVDDALTQLAQTAGKIKIVDFYTQAPGVKQEGVENLAGTPWWNAATSIGEYALFGGGNTVTSGSTNTASVIAYTAALVKSAPAQLSTARCMLAGVNVGDYALFGGGTNNASAYYRNMDGYTSQLVSASVTALDTARYGLSAANVGDYALFAGGRYTYGNTAAVDAYTSDLVHSTITELSTARYNLAATTIGDFALFGGGTSSDVVDVYSSALVKSIATSLGGNRELLAASSLNDYALFGGGRGSASSGEASVYAYSPTLVMSAAPDMSAARHSLAAAATAQFALFGGGVGPGSAAVDAYSSDLLHTTWESFSQERYSLAAAQIDGIVFFGGGRWSNTIYGTVDAYSANYIVSIDIPPWCAYKFDGFHDEEQITISGLPWFSAGMLNGYIKQGGFTVSGLIS